MLVLSRRIGEEIFIGPDIKVKVVKIRDGWVGLGITAPINVALDRAEIVSREDYRCRAVPVEEKSNASL